MANTRDYSLISDSAVTLMLLKAQTNIPYAHEAANHLLSPEKVKAYSDRNDFGFWASVVHFEHRYVTVNQLIADSKTDNLLELSSGLTYRGHNLLQTRIVKHCIDTDLPDIIQAKKDLATALGIKTPAGGRMQMLPLNVMDREQFNHTVTEFDSGKLLIVNEGLLVYLNKAEIEQLCKTIHTILKERGGYWITSDIYIKHAFVQGSTRQTKEWDSFFKRQSVSSFSFADFQEAQDFFEANGFTVDKVAAPAYEGLSSAASLMAVATEEQLNALRSDGQIQATWRLACKS
ncbi:leucine carboxyl methyltransferase [Pontibacter ummariensis]|uniref:Leucine carboxyl methyltransferase n=1 Tax=Pontibacter ummariensis TaxID=1610492 RepID=A0A239L5R6_9BACT|nr:class I SAM-dependent methyltransferase [Pontibacter ummariensis]PRY04298.1 leucine carboxyl methyltransferase [Pontibacter ummariensis]SNT25956.1 Leucine carboxyl methyltransferase [Pontibacter ummariensis]